jgi:hypothetical protein
MVVSRIEGKPSSFREKHAACARARARRNFAHGIGVVQTGVVSCKELERVMPVILWLLGVPLVVVVLLMLTHII